MLTQRRKDAKGFLKIKILCELGGFA